MLLNNATVWQVGKAVYLSGEEFEKTMMGNQTDKRDDHRDEET